MNVSEDTLRRWKDLLEKEVEDVPITLLKGNAAYTVSEEIYDLLLQSEKDFAAKANKPAAPPPPSVKGIAFRDVTVGTTYKFRSDHAVKPPLHGARITITKKNRTRVVGIMEDATTMYNLGQLINLTPNMLEHI